MLCEEVQKFTIHKPKKSKKCDDETIGKSRAISFYRFTKVISRLSQRIKIYKRGNEDGFVQSTASGI